MIRKLIMSISAALCCMACEEALPGYNTSWIGVQFVLDENSLAANEFSYSFVGQDESVTQDTVWLTVRPLGLVPERTCRIKLEQYEGTEWQFVYGENGGVVDSVSRVLPRQAVPGVHYVPFDDERMLPFLTLEPGEMEARIPVIVLRDESLSDTTYTLFLRLADSEDLHAGVEEYCNVEIRIADCLSKPAYWDDWFFAGTWSAVRQEFMMEVTGEPWDDEFVAGLTLDDKNYYLYVFNRELERVNAERAAQGLPPLRENPDDPNTELTFPTVANW